MDTATVVVRSDPPSLAGAAMRALGRNDRRSNRDRLLIFGLLGVAAAAWLFAAIQFFWGDEWTGVLVAVLVALVCSAAYFTFAARGVVAPILIATSAAAAALWFGWSTLNWGGLVAGAVLPFVGAFAAMTARRPRVSRPAAAIGIAALTPVVYVLFAAILGEWVVLVAAVLVAAGVAQQVDARHRARVRAASRRSNIPMMASAPFSTALLGVAGPSLADAVQIQSQVDAQRRTAELLTELPDGWYVFHSRVTSFGDVVDHIVVGPPGVVALRSEVVPVVIDEVPLAQIDDESGAVTAVSIDGAINADTTYQELLCWCAIGIDDALVTPGRRRTTRAVFVAHDAQIDGGRLEHVLEVGGAPDVIEYVTGPHLVPLLMELPSLGRDAQFVADLAAVVDYLLPIEK
jgi:hypothetical protein